MKRMRTRRTARPDAGGYGPSLETLEARRLLSGNVAAAVVDGSLFLTGDSCSNDLVVDQVGLNVDQLRISSGSNTTWINGQADAVILDGFTSDAWFDMGCGNDALSISAELPGELTIETGWGRDAVALLGLVAPGNVAIDTGACSDEVLLASVGIGGNVDVTGTCGNDLLEVTDDSGIGGDLTVEHGSGDNEVFVDSSAVGGRLRITNTCGDDAFSLIDSAVGDRLRILNGYGSAQTIIADSAVGEDIRILTSGGDTDASISGSWVGRDLRIKNGDGDDRLSMTDYSGVGRHMTVVNNNGDSLTDISGASIGGDLVVRNRCGYDALAATDYTVVGGDTLIKNRDGGSEAVLVDFIGGGNLDFKADCGVDVFDAFGLTLGENLVIRPGDGVDEIMIDDATVGGTTLIKTGGGRIQADVIWIERRGTDDGPRTVFAGEVRILAQCGDDEVLIGLADSDGNSVDFEGGVVLKGGTHFDILDILGNGNTGFDMDDINGFEEII
jgi:hypothetical protein